MKYWLTILVLISAIDDSNPTLPPKPSPVGSSYAEISPTTLSSYSYLKPEEIDFHSLHEILSALSDNRYIYYEHKSAKEL